MELNYIKSGSGYPIIILHGLFGMLDNWKTIARSLEEKFTVYLIDQRNHGKSPHTPEHSYQLMADDLSVFFTHHQISKAHIIGHSMGGKTAMQFALQHPEKVNKLIIVDMGIKRYPGGHDSIFDALQSIDLKTIHSRKDAEILMADKLSDITVQQFLLKNLSRNVNGSYRWKFNLEALSANYDDEILAPVKVLNTFTGDVLFVRGENSKYIVNEDWDDIQKVFPNAILKIVEDSGHWVHAEQPEAFLHIVLTFIT